MGKEILTFGDIEIEKRNLLQEDPYFLKDVDIEKVLASSKIYFGDKNYKYFFGYLYTPFFLYKHNDYKHIQAEIS